MDFGSFSLGFGLGYLAALLPWRRRPTLDRGELLDMLERGRHHKTLTTDDITDDIARAAEERMRRARERRDA